MALAIVVPPAADKPVLTVEEAAEHLNITADDLASHRGNISRAIAAVTAWLVGRDGWLGRSLVAQTLELRVALPYWPWESIVLPRPPFLELLSVVHTDEAGTAVEVDIDDLAVATGEDGLAYLGPKVVYAWPGALSTRGRLTIRYRAGYGDDGPSVDPGIRQAILMTVARLHENRGDGLTSGLRDDPFIYDLFAPYRVWTRT